MIRSPLNLPLAAGVLAASLTVAANAQPMARGPMGDGATMDFVTRAAQSDKFEITEGKLAATRAHDPRVRRFAAMMISAHTKTTAGLKMAVRRAHMPPPPPPMLRPDQEHMVGDLRAARGPAFDKIYVDQQVQAHQDALNLMQGYAQNGPVPPIRMAAQKTTPIVQQHLDMAQHLQGDMH